WTDAVAPKGPARTRLGAAGTPVVTASSASRRSFAASVSPGLGCLVTGLSLLRRKRQARARLWPARRLGPVVAGAGLSTARGAGDFEYRINLEGLVALCKRRGFVFPSGEIYGGYNGFFDYGPLGAELKNNLKKLWWRRMVHARDDVVGLDSSIVTTPSVHKASGHVENFSDPMVDCRESKQRFRADQLMWAKVEAQGREQEGEECLGYVSMVEDGNVAASLQKAAKKLQKKAGRNGELKPMLIKDMTEASDEEVELIPSPGTGKPGSLTPARAFNLMFETQVGPYADAASKSYLRPETAQGIFVNYKQVTYVMRQKVPFGIAQIGKAFRNEITPRQFLFRSREFEQMEIEYFIDPEADFRQIQEEWIQEMWNFLKAVGLKESLMDREVHEGAKLAHYARACTDIVFRYPFGTQELLGVAARGEYDLQQHAKASGQAMEYQVPGQKRKFVPHVIEPSLGVDRLFLALLCSAYDEDVVDKESRSLLRFHPCVAPITCAVFPLMKKPPALAEKAKALAARLRQRGWNVLYDEAGSIGKRYRRMDEVGTPFCCTVDFDTLEDDTVTVRRRDDPLEVTRMPCDSIAMFLDDECQLPM
ncbi:glyQS, partial [Symbiodinium sp. CCMP2456]